MISDQARDLNRFRDFETAHNERVYNVCVNVQCNCKSNSATGD